MTSGPTVGRAAAPVPGRTDGPSADPADHTTTFANGPAVWGRFDRDYDVAGRVVRDLRPAAREYRYDRLGRLVEAVDHGTDGGSTPRRLASRVALTTRRDHGDPCGVRRSRAGCRFYGRLLRRTVRDLERRQIFFGPFAVPAYGRRARAWRGRLDGRPRTKRHSRRVSLLPEIRLLSRHRPSRPLTRSSPPPLSRKTYRAFWIASFWVAW